jgi:hypothetical protein
MKLGLQNHAVGIATENSCIEFNNNKTVYKGMTLHKITEFYTKWFSGLPNITPKFRTTAIFKALSKKITIQIKLSGISRIFHCAKFNLSKRNGS